jgi:hypothetical protein
MSIRTLFLFISTAAFAVSPSLALSLEPRNAITTRRATLDILWTSAALCSASPVVAAAADDDTSSSVFLGTYTDPINHPGGTRTIQLTGTSFAGYTLASVKGGGGQGEPESYELPAMVFDCPGRGDQAEKFCISIDFSPKGGPKDFKGYWDEESKGIRFVLDGNFWPKHQS